MTIEALKVSQNKIEIRRVDGTHHFHMIKPQHVSELILTFLAANLPASVEITSKL
jgi:hypothetical protein